MTENDAGVYTCITNTTLDQDSASAELTVVGKFRSPGAQSRLPLSVSRLISGASTSCQQHEYLIVTFSSSGLMFFIPMFLTT